MTAPALFPVELNDQEHSALCTYYELLIAEAKKDLRRMEGIEGGPKEKLSHAQKIVGFIIGYQKRLAYFKEIKGVSEKPHPVNDTTNENKEQ